MKDISVRVEELTFEKMVEENLTTAEDKVVDLEKKIEDLKCELLKKEEAKFVLSTELDKAKRWIILNHREDSRRLNIKSKCFYPLSIPCNST